MNLPPSASPWQPLTFGGVAAFAQGTLTRLWKVQLLIALGVALSVLWLFLHALVPWFESMLVQLPAEGAINAGRLTWPEESPRVVGLGRMVALTVDPTSSGSPGSAADLEVVLGPTSGYVGCLLGRWQFGYPMGWRIALARHEVDAWWRAWESALLAGLGLGVFVALLLSWWLMACAYAVPAWLLAFYWDRRLTLAGAWRLSSAALLPGALLMGMALVLYSLQELSFLALLLVYAVHLPVGWIYVGGAVWRLPRLSASEAPATANPFDPGASRRARRGASNPFAEHGVRAASPFASRPHKPNAPDSRAAGRDSASAG